VSIRRFARKKDLHHDERFVSKVSKAIIARFRMAGVVKKNERAFRKDRRTSHLPEMDRNTSRQLDLAVSVFREVGIIPGLAVCERVSTIPRREENANFVECRRYYR